MIAKTHGGFSFNLGSLETLWRHTANMIFEFDSKLRLISVNPSAQNYLHKNLKIRDFLGKSCTEIFGLEAGTYLDEILSEIQRDKKVFNSEIQISDSAGEQLFEIEGILSWNEIEQENKILIIARDITSKRRRFKELAEQLEQQKNFLHKVIDTSPNHIFVKNSKGQYTLINEATARFFGRQIHEVLGRTDKELASEYADQFTQQDSKLLRLENHELLFQENVRNSLGQMRSFQTIKKLLVDPRTDEAFVLGNAVDITDICEAEQAIRKSENLLRTVITNSPIIIFAIDRDGIFTLSDGQGLEKLNLEPGQVVGQSFFELYKDYPEVLSTIRKVLDTGVKERNIYSFEGRSFETTLTPIYDNSQINGLIGVAYDVTEREKAESALKFTQFSIDKSGEAAVWVNAEGRIIYVNNGACNLSGYTREELLEMSIFEICPSKDNSFWNLHWPQLKKVGSATTEAELIRKDGTRTPIEVSQNFIRFDNKEFNCAFVKDISERKRYEQALVENENRFRSMADSSPAFIWIFSRDGNCEYANKTFLEYLGKSEQDILGKGWQNVVHPEDLRFLRHYISRLIDSPSLGNIEMLVLREDGVYRWILAQGVPRFDQQDSFRDYLITAIDITERKEAVDALRKAARELERSNRELEQFAYIASHDLQEPLRMISGFCELLHEQYYTKLDEQANEYLDFILDGAHRMSSLIRDLLLYSRTSRKQSDIEYVDCHQVINVIMKNNLKLSIEQSNAEIKLHTLPKIRANFNQMVQVFQNLIDNAIKYKNENSRPIIEIGAQLKNDDWVFFVKDNGKGFDMKYREKIFQIFQRLERRGKTPGSGIGLAIAKKIIENSGGHIWVESIPSHGSTFYFTWPSDGRAK